MLLSFLSFFAALAIAGATLPLLNEITGKGFAVNDFFQPGILVIGASVSGIVFMLSQDFTKWVLIANVITFPVTYILMNQWLQNFAYKTSINLWIFILPALLALVIALLTVSFQVIKAAIADPVNSLRYE